MRRTGWVCVVGAAMFFAAQIAMADPTNVLTFDQLGVLSGSQLTEPILNFYDGALRGTVLLAVAIQSVVPDRTTA